MGLATKRGIFMLGTVPVKAAERNNKLLNNKIDALPLNGKKEYCFECGTVDLDKSIDDDVGSTTLIINEDKNDKAGIKAFGPLENGPLDIFWRKI